MLNLNELIDDKLILHAFLKYSLKVKDYKAFADLAHEWYQKYGFAWIYSDYHDKEFI